MLLTWKRFMFAIISFHPSAFHDDAVIAALCPWKSEPHRHFKKQFAVALIDNWFFFLTPKKWKKKAFFVFALSLCCYSEKHLDILKQRWSLQPDGQSQWEFSAGGFVDIYTLSYGRPKLFSKEKEEYQQREEHMNSFTQTQIQYSTWQVVLQ